MRFLVGYASTDGQTRKIARFAADRLVDAGHSVELMPVAEAEGLELDRFDAAVLGASVHAGDYQKAFRRFCADHAGALSARPTLFLSVSLTAAGDDAEDWESLRGLAETLAETTGWRPDTVLQVAGAFRFSEYNFLETWMMRWIARQKDPEVDGRSDREYTDWDALAARLEDWTRAIGAGKQA